MTLCFRNYDEDVVLRAEGRTIYGVIVPYNDTITVNDGRGEYRERFMRGAFKRSIEQTPKKGFQLYANHETRRFPIGRSVELREEQHGLVGAFAVSQTQGGDEALTLVADGVVRAFSVGFSPIQERAVDGVVERTEVALREVSLVGMPAYDNAVVAGVRHQGPEQARALLSITLRKWNI
jgi:HK97 family phage prohead protease